ncbi:serine/threonine-protein kinase Nek4-like isoform X5 [Crassostrea angulata]|uniref:serine/threonine-protein kinase Nek4-like isoform X5 n=1 Tax=Magallana angulata TaxID=2784310 RepID=UPI0022B0F448|nr:serine/threonine-protein kinase Nek4-like isoform X5 [Crassostrea angulata]
MAGLDQFEFIRQIGKGSYGEVTLQRHKKDRKQYVLKRINLKKASKREQHAAEQEAKLLSKLKHPNIVTYKDSFQGKDGYLHIAMQFCEGGDLYTKLKEQKGVPLEERQVVEWFVQIAMALQYMHERNILHRDLKTQNIFLTKSKIIKVGDLGIARVLESSSDMATTLIGTPYYMSPELFSNKPYNHKSDVWALGCCVYEMATLKHAFNAKDMNSLVYKILKGKMPLMPKQYSPELIQIIKNMLHQEPEKRPSVNRILRDPYIKKNISIFLEETKKSRPSSASRPGTAQRLRPKTAPSNRPPAPLPSSEGSNVNNNSASKMKVHVPEPDGADSTDSAQSVPQPAILRKKGHARKPSDGAKQDLFPIVEDKVISDNHHRNLESSTSSEDTVKANTAKEKSESQSPPRKYDRDSAGGRNSPKKKKNVLRRPARDSDTDSLHSVRSEPNLSARSDSSSSSSSYAKNDVFRKDTLEGSGESVSHGRPKPVSNPRPLPTPPKVSESAGIPVRRPSYEDKLVENNKSSSTSSSKDESCDMETPREPNLSARQRRREKNPAGSSLERPNSARIHLKAPSRHESERVTKAEKSVYGPKMSKSNSKRVRQPSIKDSSSSEEETLKENEDFKKEREKHRENKEMNNFISLLDTTLKMNKEDDDKSEEDDEVKEVKSHRRVSQPTKPSDADIHRSASLPSVETLCNADRLTTRIQILHTDCVRGVGFEVLHKAFEILSNIEDDELEVAEKVLPQLVDLMGKDKFDQYAGKIWQLKFCNECFEQLPHLRS